MLRGGYDVLDWDRDQTYKGIDYEAKIDFKSPGAFVDLHPFENGFLVSGGAYQSARRLGKSVAQHLPRPVRAAAKKAEEYARGWVTGGTFFEECNFATPFSQSAASHPRMAGSQPESWVRT